MMSHLRQIFNNVTALAVIAGLVAITLWLVLSRGQAPQPAAQATASPPATEPPPDTATPPAPTPSPSQAQAAASPTAGYTPPSKGVVVTVFPTPTRAPSPTPTPTFEPLSNRPIGGYVFGPPELLFTSEKEVELIQWLPGNDDQLILMTDKQLIEVLETKTGSRRELAKAECCIIGKPIWLPATQQIAYLLQSIKDGNLGAEKLYVADVATTNSQDIKLPLVPSMDGRAVLVLNERMDVLQNKSQGIERSQVSLEEPLPTVEPGPFAHYQAAWSDKHSWIAYYNNQNLILINQETGERKAVELTTAFGNRDKLWVTCATWSPDGQNLALIIGEGGSVPLHFTKIAIFEFNANEIRVIEDDVTYVTDIAWSPDSKQVLMEGIVGLENGFEKRAVFLVDLSQQSVTPVPIMPADALGGSSCNGLAWSPDGDTVVFGYSDIIATSQVGWYRVNISKP